MPLALLLRYWKYGAALLALLGIWLWHEHALHAAHDAGWAENEARWQPILAAAQQELAAANARTQALESAAQAITNESEARHAQTIADLNQRAADADTRVRGLVRKLAASHSCGGTVSEAANASTVPDAAGAGDERVERAGGDLTGLARRCESDARTLTELQGWVREQQSLVAVPPQ